MGLYIPDLRLPDDGDFELWIAMRKDGSFTYNIRGGWQDGKQKAVLVSPPRILIEKHDVFKLITAFPEVDKLLPVEFMEALYNLPTIIPAEEK